MNNRFISKVSIHTDMFIHESSLPKLWQTHNPSMHTHTLSSEGRCNTSRSLLFWSYRWVIEAQFPFLSCSLDPAQPTVLLVYICTVVQFLLIWLSTTPAHPNKLNKVRVRLKCRLSPLRVLQPCLYRHYSPPISGHNKIPAIDLWSWQIWSIHNWHLAVCCGIYLYHTVHIRTTLNAH